MFFYFFQQQRTEITDPKTTPHKTKKPFNVLPPYSLPPKRAAKVKGFPAIAKYHYHIF